MPIIQHFPDRRHDRITRVRKRRQAAALQALSLLPFFLAAVLPLAAVAGSIRIETDVAPESGGPAPAFAVKLANSGNEPALNVRAVITVGEVHAEARPLRELPPGAPHSLRLACTNAPALPGFYTATLSLAYTDREGAPFSAVSPVEIRVGESGPPPEEAPVLVVADCAAAPLARSGTLTLSLTPLVDQPLDITVRLVLPAEIAADRPVRPLRLDPDRPDTVTFELRPAGARAGSEYAVFCVLDAVVSNRHWSTSVPASITVVDPWGGCSWSAVFWFALALVSAAAFGLAQCRFRLFARPAVPVIGQWPVSLLLVSGASLFILWHLSPADLIRDTMTVGGDTPAHNYLASHLKEQWLGHGRLVSWANGWWGGFPMFQYYFTLPYALIALLSTALPFNIAFKLVTVSGALLLPLAALALARLMRLPRHSPELLATLMVPFLFVETHTMWGVNLSSTLAGMIANSLSFTLMLLAMGLAWRDAADGTFRLRTVAALTLVMASHFFTSVMTALVLLAYPVLQPAGRRRSALVVLAGEGALAVLLMAWWLVPLVATQASSMEFGTNWDMTLWKNFPPYAAGLVVLAGVAVGWAVQLRQNTSPDFAPPGRAILALVWLLLAALFLYRFGFSLSPVFVNVRLWPFLFFALVALGAVGGALLLARARAVPLALLAVLAAVLGGVTLQEHLPGATGGRIRAWAHWNYSGLESKPEWPAFRDLILPLRGTPGRLANDLSEENTRLGSSRIFECVPHLTGKPILEGGLVNSAAGALFAYYIQSETSESCAGYPPMMVPGTFNLTNATRHLELFNVKHFMARWPALQQALAASPDWRRRGSAGGWDLYELLTHEGHAVQVLEAEPPALVTADWKRHALEWFYVPAALSAPVLLVPPGGPLPPGARVVTEAEFMRDLSAVKAVGEEGKGAFEKPTPAFGHPSQEGIPGAKAPASADTPGAQGLSSDGIPGAQIPSSEGSVKRQVGLSLRPSSLPRGPSPLASPSPLAPRPSSPVLSESVSDDRIVFTTTAIGRPHLIKINWFPNWQVRGADAVYRVTPDFMLVYPRQSRVELDYGFTGADRIGLALTWLGWGLVAAGLLRHVRRRRSCP